MAIRMKMKQKKIRKIGIASALGLLVLVMLGLYGASNYMLNYSLNYPKEERMTAEHWKNRMKNECPWMIGWMDSVYQHHCVKDTFVVMPSGYKAHAIYLYAPKTTEKTAVVVHGYQVRSEGMLHIAYLYNHDMGYNVLLPDLYGHGESEGDHIQMGWKDRWDVIRWSEVANEIFKVKSEGEKVENEERRVKNTTSALCQHRYGWSFAEAQQIEQVRKSTKPMLFIHGDKDAFVPYAMLHPLYEAKTKGRKAIFIAKGSVHAMAYRDHHEKYTRIVKDFVSKEE